jgi:DNA polymerase-4
VLLELTEQVAWRLRREAKRGRTVQLKLRCDDFTTLTRARSLRAPTDATQELWATALALLERELTKGIRPLRLLGMGVSGFADEPGVQADLFAQPHARAVEVDQVADRIKARFGPHSLQRARGVRRAD